MNRYTLLSKLTPEGSKWTYAIYLNRYDNFLCAGTYATRRLAEKALEVEMEEYRKIYSIQATTTT